MKPNELFIIILLGGGIPLLIGLAVIYVMHRCRKGGGPLHETSRRLGTRCNLFGKYIVNKGALSYWYQYFSGSKNSPPFLGVGMVCDSHGEFTLVRESKFDKAAKRIGFSSELETGDKDFDDNYYILSDTLDFAKIYFQSEKRRDIIKEIYRSGFTQIKHNGKTLEATWEHFDEEMLNSELIETTAGRLVELSQGLPDYFADAEVFGIPRQRVKTITAYVISSLAAVAVPITWFWGMIYPPLDSFPVFFRSLSFSIPAVILYLVVTALAIRGSSAAHKNFIRIAVISLIAFICLVNNLIVLINGEKDTSKPVIYQALVLNKYVTHSKNSTSYYAVVRSWRPGRFEERFRINSAAYNRIQANKTVAAITTKSGALGFEWVLSERF